MSEILSGSPRRFVIVDEPDSGVLDISMSVGGHFLVCVSDICIVEPAHMEKLAEWIRARIKEATDGQSQQT